MLQRTMQFYIFKNMLKMTVFFTLAISLLVYLIDFTELNNRLSSIEGYKTSFGLTLAGLRVLFIIQVATPFLILAATMATLMQLNRKNELVVARSVGVSAWQFLAPLWLFAFLMGCFSVLVLNPVATNGFSYANEMEGSIRGRPPTSGPLSDRNPWLRQQAEDGGAFLIGAQRVSARGVQLIAPRFIKMDADNNLVERYDAATATLSENAWQLKTVTITKPGQAGTAQEQLTIPTDLDPAIVTEALIPAEMIPFLQLRHQIDNARVFGVSTSAFEMQYHSMIALPALLIAMTLIGATVSLRFVRFGVSPGMVLGGIIAGFVLYVVTKVAGSFGAAGIVSPVVAAWAPVLAAGMFGVAYILHREDG